MLTIGLLSFLTTAAQGQLIYSEDFSSSGAATNWVVNYSESNGPTNSQVLFGFDYSTLGVPAAPHSVGGNTKALKMTPDYGPLGSLLGTAAVPGVSVSPTNFSISENFIMHADMWVNVNGTPYAALQTNNVSGASYATSPHNGSSSTVLYGCGYGTAGTKAIVAGQVDGIFCAIQSDNGSSAMLRMYGPNQAASYQDGWYQNSGSATPAFPGDPFVYNNTTGSRGWVKSTGSPPFTFATNAAGVSWASIFPSVPVPLAEQILLPTLTNNASIPGLVQFGWHDVSVQKVGTVIIYSIDGNVIATAPYSTAGTPAGGFLLFSAGDISASPPSSTSSTTALYTNLNYVLFANITVSNYDNIVNVSATTPTTIEGSPGSPAVFTLTRSSAGVPLTVNYTLTGTATNGTQYVMLATNVTFASTATTTNINIVPIDDGIPSVASTVILTIQPGDGYAGAGNALVTILDGDTPTLDITGGSRAYGRYTNDPTATTGGNNDFIAYTLTRRGKITTGSDLSVNLSYGGSAVGGVDYTPLSTVTIPDGVTTVTLPISPVDNPNVSTNRTVVVNLVAGTGYAIGSGTATGTVVSAHYPIVAPVVLADDLSSAADAVNWNITYGCGDPLNDSVNYSADFGFNLDSAFGIGVPRPPGDSATALHLTCNKNNGSTPAPGAVNAYYTNLWLSGNYAVRFNMNIIQGQTLSAATEGVLFGINHSGTCSNWWYGSGTLTNNETWSSDGIWYLVTTQPSGSTAGDYQEFTGLGGTNGNTGWTRLGAQLASSFTQTFKDNYSLTYPGPFTCFNSFNAQTPGVPANGSIAFGYDASTWSDVEIKQLNNIVTMSINHTAIFTYTNTTVWTNGYLMLGYADPYGGSVGAPEAGVYFANLQVVQLPVTSVITITSITSSGGNVTITFTTSSPTDTTGSFAVYSSPTVNGAYSSVGGTITSLGGQSFQVTLPQNGAQQFYRIYHP